MSELRQRKPPKTDGTASDAAPEKRQRPVQDASLPAPNNSRGLFEAGGLFLLFLLATTVPIYMLYDRLGGETADITSTGFVRNSYALCSPDDERIYTVDDNNAKVQCLVVHHNKILAIGSLDEVKKQWNILSLLKDDLSMQGNLPVHYIPAKSIIIPSFSDAHGHVLEYGASRQLVLEGTKSIQETITRIRNYVLGNPELYGDTDKLIFGSNWDQMSWKPQRWPTTDDLENDIILRGRRIILQSKDYHALWVSRRMLDAVSYFPETVEGGAIIRDKAGKPTGVLLDRAQNLIDWPAPTEQDLEKRLAITAHDALSQGLTSVHDAGLKPVSLEFFRKMAAKGKLPLRIYGMAYFNESAKYWGDQTKPIIGAGQGTLTIRSVKMFADGALRTGGAALYQPYSDNPETHGFMRIEPELLHDVVPKFLRDGWQVNIHAIGDRANGIVLDTFEAALAKDKTDVAKLRPRLEHAQILAEEDMQRFGKLGVIASIQPTHVISDMWYAEDRLGPERVKGLYAYRSILDHGARLAFGTDFPVERMNPFLTFYSAITRVSIDGTSPHGPGGWFPEQRLTREEALRGMTMEPAYASFTEDILGSIVPGKLADFAILSHDIMKVPAKKILETKVIGTVMDGQVVYGNLGQ